MSLNELAEVYANAYVRRNRDRESLFLPNGAKGAPFFNKGIRWVDGEGIVPRKASTVLPRITK